MKWQNTETPTFRGSDNDAAAGPDVVESFQLLDRTSNVMATFTKAVDGNTSLALPGSLVVTGNLQAPIVGPPNPYSGVNSFQPVGPDLPLAAAAGSDEPTDPSFLAAVMGNVIGDEALTNQANYLAGVIGANALDCSASDYPTGCVMGVLFDGAQVDSIILADLDGDDGGAPTNARAAFGVKVNNNNPSSGCEFGLSLFDVGNANYTGGGNPFTPSKADIEFHTEAQFRSFTTAITENVTTTDAPAGSLGITTHATGLGKLFYSDGSKWQLVIAAAA